MSDCGFAHSPNEMYLDISGDSRMSYLKDFSKIKTVIGDNNNDANASVMALMEPEVLVEEKSGERVDLKMDGEENPNSAIREMQEGMLIGKIIQNLVQQQNSEETINQSDIQQNRSGNKAKKRTLNKESWKRYKKSREVLFSRQRREVPSCRCKCSEKINVEEQQSIFEHFLSLGSHTQQNSYLDDCILKSPKKRCRSRKGVQSASKRKTTFKYFLKTEGKVLNVCQPAFLAIHGIKRSRLRRKIQDPGNSTFNDLRGKHKNRPNKTNQEFLQTVRNFISDLPACVSHYSRSENKLQKFLDTNLTVAKLYRMYSEKNKEHKVSYEIFRRIFNDDFNISFGHPQKDVCSICAHISSRNKQSEVSEDESLINKMRLIKELHLEEAEQFQRKLLSAKCSANNNVLSICFDYQKNLPVPVTNVPDECYLQKLWIYNFGIHCIKTGKAVMYTCAEHFAQKGPNEVISCLEDFIRNCKTNETVLQIFCDNCYSQNKNRFLLAFLDQLCVKKIFESIEVVYPLPGHSAMPIDADFARIEMQRRKQVLIDNPEFYVNLIKSCRQNQPFECVFLERSLRSDGHLKHGDRIIQVKDFTSGLNPHLKSSVPAIFKARRIIFDASEEAKWSENYCDETETLRLYKVGRRRAISDNPPLLYCGQFIKLQQAKYENIVYLVKQIQSRDIEFFTRTLSYNAGTILPTRVEIDDVSPNLDQDTDIYE